LLAADQLHMRPINPAVTEYVQAGQEQGQ
jgi:hypothetical protein